MGEFGAKESSKKDGLDIKATVSSKKLSKVPDKVILKAGGSKKTSSKGFVYGRACDFICSGPITDLENYMMPLLNLLGCLRCLN